MDPSRSLYEILGITENADSLEINERFSSLLRHLREQAIENNADITQSINELYLAYRFLADPVERCAYDACLRKQRAILEAQQLLLREQTIIKAPRASMSYSQDSPRGFDENLSLSDSDAISVDSMTHDSGNSATSNQNSASFTSDRDNLNCMTRTVHAPAWKKKRMTMNSTECITISALVGLNPRVELRPSVPISMSSYHAGTDWELFESSMSKLGFSSRILTCLGGTIYSLGYVTSTKQTYCSQIEPSQRSFTPHLVVEVPLARSAYHSVSVACVDERFAVFLVCLVSQGDRSNEYQLWRSDDAMRSWYLISRSVPQTSTRRDLFSMTDSSSYKCISVAAISSEILLLNYYSTLSSTMLRSFDGGHTWDEIENMDQTLKIFASEGNIFAVRTDGNIFTSTDKGSSWLPRSTVSRPGYFSESDDVFFDPVSMRLIFVELQSGCLVLPGNSSGSAAERIKMPGGLKAIYLCPLSNGSLITVAGDEIQISHPNIKLFRNHFVFVQCLLKRKGVTPLPLSRRISSYLFPEYLLDRFRAVVLSEAKSGMKSPEYRQGSRDKESHFSRVKASLLEKSSCALALM